MLHPLPSSAEGLLQLPSEEFVLAAYRFLLFREADASGLAHYLTRVVNGEDKLAIAAEIASSEEARALPCTKKRAIGEILALQARALMKKSWSRPQRDQAAQCIVGYFSVLTPSKPSGADEDGSTDAKSNDPFSNYLQSVIKNQGS